VQNAELAIYNSKGQKIKTFNQTDFSKESSIVWNGKNDLNEAVSSGIYFCRLKAGSKKEITKIMLMK